jgi:2-keto-4-pentenoate hydratase
MTLQTIADALATAERDARPIPPVSLSWPGLTVAEAYAVQRLNAGERVVVGHKIGLTAKPMQELLGVDQPDYGVLYEDRVHATGAQLDVSGLIAPRVEPEFAFVLARELRGPGLTASEVLAATAAIVPALEVIDSRIRDWKIRLVDTIADNASCHCAILGERHPAAGVDLPTAAVAMSVDGELEQQGVGAAVLGDPAEAVAWLANELAAYGVTLEAGHVVLSGSITAAVPFVAGSHVVADFGPLGKVEVSGR